MRTPWCTPRKAVLEAAQDADGVLDRGLTDQHLLEPAFEAASFDAAVPVERVGRPAAARRGPASALIMLAGVHRALAGGAGADDGCSSSMNVMTWTGGVLDVVDGTAEAFLEFTAVLGAGHHRSEVQGDHGLVAQALRDVAGDDALGQALDDGGLPDAAHR